MKILVILLALAWVPLAWAARPDAVVVLGCQNEEELAARVDAAARLIESAGARHVPLVILSGGARYRGGTEASVLAGRLARKLHGRAVQARFIEETESLDTVGNALFSAYALVGRPVREVVLVTSDFHASRSLMYFERTLPAGCHVTAVGARPHPRTDVEIARRAAHERASATQSFADIFDAPPALARGDLAGLLARVVERHKYYLGRRDLLARHGVAVRRGAVAP